MQADRDQVLQTRRASPPPAFSFSFFAVSKQETSKQGDKEVNSFWVCLWSGESDVKGGPSTSNWKEKRESSCSHQLSFELKFKKRGAWIHNKPETSKSALTHYSS